MEYEKTVNLLENTPDQPYKFRTKNLVEVNDELGGTYIINIQIKFKTSMLKSSLCDYSDPYILVSGTITITGAGVDAAARQVDKEIQEYYLKIAHHLLIPQAKRDKKYTDR